MIDSFSRPSRAHRLRGISERDLVPHKPVALGLTRHGGGDARRGADLRERVTGNVRLIINKGIAVGLIKMWLITL